MKAKSKSLLSADKSLGKTKAEKPLGKRCKFYSREACYLEDCDTCIIKDAYEQGKSDGRKQTLEEVLKEWKRGRLRMEFDLWLRRKLKEASK